jgi:hypothetical protein
MVATCAAHACACACAACASCACACAACAACASRVRVLVPRVLSGIGFKCQGLGFSSFLEESTRT